MPHAAAAAAVASARESTGTLGISSNRQHGRTMPSVARSRQPKRRCYKAGPQNSLRCCSCCLLKAPHWPMCIVACATLLACRTLKRRQSVLSTAASAVLKGYISHICYMLRNASAALAQLAVQASRSGAASSSGTYLTRAATPAARDSFGSNVASAANLHWTRQSATVRPQLQRRAVLTAAAHVRIAAFAPEVERSYRHITATPDVNPDCNMHTALSSTMTGRGQTWAPVLEDLLIRSCQLENPAG
jgi:hypothetical protein